MKTRRQRRLKAAVAGDRAPSWLEQAPRAWTQQLIRMLRLEDQRSLFQTCKAVAKLVLAHVPKVKFWICQGDASQGYTMEDVEARRSFITELLDVDRDLELTQLFSGKHPFPTRLSHRVVRLAINDSDPSYDCFEWAALTSLQELVWVWGPSERGVDRMCDALKAGHLKQLHKLTFRAESANVQISKAVLTRFAQVLGPQIAHLGPSPIVHPYLHYFTVLHSVETQEQPSKELCEHATVRVVTWRAQSSPIKHGDFVHCRCSWETLILDDVRPSCLATLPLTGLKEIHFLGQLSTFPPSWCRDDDEWQVLQGILSQHSNKIVCVPKTCVGDAALAYPHYITPTYCMTRLCKEEICLVGKLREPCKLHLCTQIVEKMSENKDLVSALWGSLPACVHSIWVELSGNCLLHVWQGLPTTVTTLCVAENYYSAHFTQVELACSLSQHIKVVHPFHYKESLRAY